VDSYPRARYLSQQFVEELCSIEGMPALIAEIERVIFEAHPSLDRDGAVNFDELLELRARQYRGARAREETALANLSDQIGTEMEKSRLVEGLKKQVSEKEKLLTRYNADRKNLLPKGKSAVADRLQKLMAAAEKVRGYLRYYANQQSSLTGLKNEVQDHRQNRAPETLRSMKERHQTIGFKPTNWDDFLLTFSGDVDATVLERAAEVDKLIQSWKGTMPTGPTDTTGAFLPATADLEKTPLAVLEAEIERLQKIVAADLETAKKLAATTKSVRHQHL
jgi:hypothetical protein